RASPSSWVPATLPRSIRTGQPPDPVPCLLLGQLATDVGWVGSGIGTGLLRHALIRCVQAAALIGGRALVARAIDDDAAAFWLRRGFLPSKDDPLTLFRSIAEIAASVRRAAD
ncbi:MAG: N-acetyltransferase, partial [Alphaproteobacteria bacterium]|nr:N-acetyltransferase [Alphaproteobacteria bacterium]